MAGEWRRVKPRRATREADQRTNADYTVLTVSLKDLTVNGGYGMGQDCDLPLAKVDCASLNYGSTIPDNCR